MKNLIKRSKLCVLLCLVAVMLVTTLPANAEEPIIGDGVVYAGCCADLKFDLTLLNISSFNSCFHIYDRIPMGTRVVGQVTHGFGFGLTCLVLHLADLTIYQCRFCPENFESFSNPQSKHTNPQCSAF
jgi:hypothetical protein